MLLQTLLNGHFSGPPYDPSAVPERALLTAGRDQLVLSFPEGQELTLGAAQIRTACRCAWCTRARADGKFAAIASDVLIKDIEPVGHYAVRLFFSDGHERGVFPWTYLKSLASQPLKPEHA